MLGFADKCLQLIFSWFSRRRFIAEGLYDKEHQFIFSGFAFKSSIALGLVFDDNEVQFIF
jgi:hypothetical protein